MPVLTPLFEFDTEDYPAALSCSSDGRWLAVGTPTVMSFHADFLSTAAFAPKGDWLLAGCRGGVLSLWPRVGAEHPAITFNLPSSIEFACWLPGKASVIAAVSKCGRLVIANIP